MTSRRPGTLWGPLAPPYVSRIKGERGGENNTAALRALAAALAVALMTVVLAVGPAAANHRPNNEVLLGVDRPSIRVSGYERAQAAGRP